VQPNKYSQQPKSGMQLKVAAVCSAKAAQMQSLLTCITLQIHCVTLAAWLHSSSTTDLKTNEQVGQLTK